jgi:hypothetical protein
MTSKIGLSSESSELFDREMKKMRGDMRIKMRAMARMNAVAKSGGSGRDGGSVGYFDMSDMTDKDIAIVCEELWLDIKLWVGQDTNLYSCGEKARLFISRNWLVLLCVVLCMIMFRWYVGGGKDACAYGVGWGAFSLVCEIMRYIGEVFMGVLLGICGFCCGVLPIIVCGCFHEVLLEDDRDETNAEKA